MRHLLSLTYIDAVVRAGSIRKAAETLAITSTALNRRILAMEEELGVPIFERLPRGVRLTAAGEIACSQALLPYFLPDQISTYRKDHPAVTFSVLLRDRAAAEQALMDLSADLALVFEPVRLTEFQHLLTIRQPVHAVMTRDHPLAGNESVRLRECVQFPLALPTADFGVRYLLETAVRRTSLSIEPTVESDSFEFLRSHAVAENILAFQIPIGLPPDEETSNVISRPVDARDIPPGLLYFGQLHSRTLPVAAARFAHQMMENFEARFECV